MRQAELNQIGANVIAALIAEGFDVYQREGEWAYFTDGTRIGHVQWSNGTIEFYSVHKPDPYLGTGFGVEYDDAEPIRVGALRALSHSSGFRGIIPRKWKDWNEFHNSSDWHKGYRKVVE